MGIVVLYLAIVPVVCWFALMGSMFALSIFQAAWFSFAVLVMPVLLALHFLRKKYPHEPVLTVWLCGFLPLLVAIVLWMGMISFKAG